MCLIPKLEEGGKAGDVMGGVDEGETEVEGLYKLEICMAKFEDVDLVSDEMTRIEGEQRKRT
jgi:hypothetical protein